jgi:hypothetical protein
VLKWIENDGEGFLRRHATLADNLKDILLQQKDFNAFYQEAVVSLANTRGGQHHIK